MSSSHSSIPPKPSSVEYPVILAKNDDQINLAILSFHPSDKFDFAAKNTEPVMMKRENNLKTFSIDSGLMKPDQPLFGKNSIFGKEQRDDARRQRFTNLSDRINKNYDIANQPWVLTSGTGSNKRQYKGSKEANFDEHCSYFVFQQTKDSRSIKAYPVNEWFKMIPKLNHEFMDIEEVEKHLLQRQEMITEFCKTNLAKLGNLGKDMENDTEDNEKGETSKNKGVKPKGKNKGKKRSDGVAQEGHEDLAEDDLQCEEVDYFSNDSASSEGDLKKDLEDLPGYGVEENEAMQSVDGEDSQEEGKEKNSEGNSPKDDDLDEDDDDSSDSEDNPLFEIEQNLSIGNNNNNGVPNDESTDTNNASVDLKRPASFSNLQPGPETKRSKLSVVESGLVLPLELQGKLSVRQFGEMMGLVRGYISLRPTTIAKLLKKLAQKFESEGPNLERILMHIMQQLNPSKIIQYGQQKFHLK